MQPKPIILYVDDEQPNLDSFQLSFMDSFNILLANSGEKALEILKKEAVEVVISDQKMSGMNGIEFLEKVHQQFPQIISILVTGYGDLQLASQAINKGKVYYYFEKPWEEDRLRKALFNAAEKYRLTAHNQQLIESLKETNRQLRQKIEDLDTIVYRSSHDINGSLARILGICQVALQEALPAQYFNMINRETSILTQTLYNIMDMHELETVQPIATMQNPAQLLKEWSEHTLRWFGLNNSAVEIEYMTEMPFSTDYDLLKKVYVPIFQNAFVHAPLDRPVKVNITTTENQLSIQVTDCGKGIDSNILYLLTQKFFKGNNLSPGNGLGLYIAEMAVRKLGGQLFINSSRSGNSFRFEIPALSTFANLNR